jgi:hypothetical protein
MKEKELQYHTNISWVAKHFFALYGYTWGVLLPHDTEPIDYEIVGCRRVLKQGDFWPLRDYFLCCAGNARTDILNKRKELGLLTDLEQYKNKDILNP